MRISTLILALSLVAGCGPATSERGPGTPEPAPGKEPPAPPPEAPRRGGASTLLYAPGEPVTYSYQRRDSLILEFPGATQVQTLDRTAYLRVSLTDGSGAYRATIVLDSLRAEPGGTVPEDSLRAADGTRWTATLTPIGELSDLQASRATTVGSQIGSTLQTLFPQLPSGGAAVGSTWVDTSSSLVRTVAFEARETGVTRYRATGSGAKEGRQTLDIESEGTFERVGTGTQFGQEMDMAASGHRRGVHHLGYEGVLVAAEGTDSSAMTITVPAVGQSVPVQQFSTYTITSLGRRSR